MGNSTSNSGKVLNKGGGQGQGPNKGGQVVASGLSDPNDRYAGPPTEHSLASISVIFHYNRGMGFSQAMTGVTWVTSDMDSYYSTLQQFYSNGMRMSEFIPLPATERHAGGFFTPGVRKWFQGIFYRDNAQPPDERWQLLINQTTLHAQMVAQGGFGGGQQTTSSDLSMLFEIVKEQTGRGARFIGLQETGTQESRMQGGFGHAHQHSAIALDVYFEVPQHPVKEIYLYHFIQTPIPVGVGMGFMSSKTKCQFDWAGQVHAFLSKGWRLVSAFMDKTNQQSTQRGMMSMPEMTQTCLWTFEKPTSRQNDETPVYEAKVVEFPYSVSSFSAFGSSSPSAQWDSTIVELSRKGWETACVLETPAMKAGMGGATVIYVLFFQRLFNYGAPAQEAPPQQMPAPPQYAPAPPQ